MNFPVTLILGTFLCFFVLFQTGVDAAECPQGEVYRECDLRCKERCNPRECELVREKCVPGCYCEDPLMARVYGKCVPRKECPPQKCGDNEEWTQGQVCQERCRNEEIFCNKEYYWGCFCKEGLVRVNGVCTKPEECEISECSEDREYLECGTPCQNMCRDDVYCRPGICVPGCYCKKGFVEIDGKCVPKEIACQEECCGENAIWTWGTDCTGCDCDGTLIKGCFCIDGYVMVDGKCVKK